MDATPTTAQPEPTEMVGTCRADNDGQVRQLVFDDDLRATWRTLKTPAHFITATRARIEYETDRAERHALSVVEFTDRLAHQSAEAEAVKEARRIVRDAHNSEIRRKYHIQCPRGYILGSRSCGHRQAALIRCGDPLCPDCERIRAARARARWLPVLEKYDAWRMCTLTIKSGHDLPERFTTFRKAFTKWLGLGMDDRGLKHWLAEMHNEAVNIVATGHSKHTVKDYDDSAKRFALQVEHIRSKWQARNPGRRFQLRHMIRGLAALEVTHDVEHGWHVHRHLVLVGGLYIPHTFVSASWQHVTNRQGRITDIRSLKGERRAFEVMKYVSKPASIPPDLADDFRAAVKGKKRLWPLGKLKPVKPDRQPCPACGSTVCSCTALAECRNGRDDIDLPAGQYHATLAGQAQVVRITRSTTAKGFEWDTLPFVNSTSISMNSRDGPHAAAGPPAGPPGQDGRP